MGQIKFVASILMAALFSIAIVGFAINFGADNDAALLVGDDADFNKINSDLKGNITTFVSDVNDSTEALMSSSLEQADTVTATGGQFKVGMGTSLSFVTTIISASFSKVFGNEPEEFGIFLTALVWILSFIFGMYIYKAWVGRNPD